MAENKPPYWPEDSECPRKWAGKRPTEEELEQILEDHKKWLERKKAHDKTPPKERFRYSLEFFVFPDPPHDLSGADLSGMNFQGYNLSDAKFRNSDLRRARLETTNLSRADFTGANLQYARLQGADLSKAILRKAILCNAHLEPYFFDHEAHQKTNLSDANLSMAHLCRTNLWYANLSGANIQSADLSSAKLKYVDLSGAWLYAADLRGADLRSANLSNADVAEVKYNHDTKFLGCRVATCYGSQRFRRFAQDQDYLEEMRIKDHDSWNNFKGVIAAIFLVASFFINAIKMILLFFVPKRIKDYFSKIKWIRKIKCRFLKCKRKTKKIFSNLTWGQVKYGIWWLLCDCGRSMWRWILFSVGLALGFASVFYFVLGPDAFDIYRARINGVDQGLPRNFWSMLYYSVVTFTTLGFGDVVPLRPAAAWWVMAEVVVGYIMLGGLISILATKLARRS